MRLLALSLLAGISVFSLAVWGCGGEDDDDHSTGAGLANDDDNDSPADDDTSPVDDDISPSDDDDSSVDDDDNDVGDDDDTVSIDLSGDYIVAAIKGQTLFLYGLTDQKNGGDLPAAPAAAEPRVEMVDGGAAGHAGTSIAAGPGGPAMPEAIPVADYAASPRLAVDVQGYYHLAYVDLSESAVVYLTDRSGSWTRVLVEQPAAGFEIVALLSLAVAGDGSARLAYGVMDVNNHYQETIHYASNAGTAAMLESGTAPAPWQVETLPDSEVIRPALTLDAQDRPHLVYFQDLGDYSVVRYAHQENDKWWARSVALNPLATPPAIAIGPDGQVHIACRLHLDPDPFATPLVHIFGWNEAWQRFTLLNKDIGSLSLAVDSQGYYHLAATGVSNLYYLTNRAEKDSRVVEVEAAESDECDLLLDAAENPVISYYQAETGALKTARLADQEWSLTALDTAGDAGTRCSLALDEQGRLRVSYLRRSTNEVMYATDAGGQWVKQAIEAAWTDYDDPPETSVAVDGDGQAHLVYYSNVTAGLQYATNRSGAWVTTTLDDNAPGLWNSVAVDREGYLHIVYADWDGNTLQYLTDRGGPWQGETIAQPFDGAYFPEVKVDAAGAVHVVYLANENTGCIPMYATNASGDWELTELTEGVGPGYSSIDLALDGDGHAHVALAAYFVPPGNKAVLAYLNNVSGAWSEETVLNQEDEQRIDHVAIGIDRQEFVHIAFCDNYQFTDDGGDLAYVTNLTGQWVKTPLTQTRVMGGYADLAIDQADTVHIVHYGEKALYHVSLSN